MRLGGPRRRTGPFGLAPPAGWQRELFLLSPRKRSASPLNAACLHAVEV